MLSFFFYIFDAMGLVLLLVLMGMTAVARNRKNAVLFKSLFGRKVLCVKCKIARTVLVYRFELRYISS